MEVPRSESFPAAPGNGEHSSRVPESGPESPLVVSSHTSLAQAVAERKAEYTESRRLRIKVGSWNVASLQDTENDIGKWFIDGKDLGSEELSDGHKFQKEAHPAEQSGPSLQDTTSPPQSQNIDIYALGLQEIVDITSAVGALKPFTDPNPTRKWKHAIEKALPNDYRLIAEQQLVGLYLIIFASEEMEAIISSVSTTSIGTGLMGYMGNKGAVAARIVLGETTKLAFINCHLSAGVEKGSLERRNWDALQIQNRIKFAPILNSQGLPDNAGEGIGDEDFAFWFGDLNYRLEDMPPEDVRRLLMLHTKNQYTSDPIPVGKSTSETIENEPLQEPIALVSTSSEAKTDDVPASPAAEISGLYLGAASYVSNKTEQDPSTDPTSLQTTLASLLPHDQLHKQMQTRGAFCDGWREGRIEFLPTYKYDVGSVGVFDSSEKRRGPSWCDRILYRTRKDKLDYDAELRANEQAKEKDNELKRRGIEDALKDEDVLFDYDPETDGAEYDENGASADPEPDVAMPVLDEQMLLDHYISHQSVLSSDHKPLDAVFRLDCDVVNLDLKAKVQQTVARELDKAENDGRPSVTIAVDHHPRETHNAEAHNFPGVNFGDVKFGCRYVRNATIANTGRVAATIGFADRSIDEQNPIGIGPTWLSVHFDKPGDGNHAEEKASGDLVLQPGDTTNLELSLRVSDFGLARRLNKGIEMLEDVLVLRISNGRDYFLPLKASWLPSAFGWSIGDLTRMPDGGIRNLKQRQPGGLQVSDLSEVRRSAPRELFRLTESLESLIERAIGEWEMQGKDRLKLGDEYLGWPFCTSKQDQGRIDILKERTRDALDCDTAFSELWPQDSTSTQRLEAVAQTLVQFLESLDDGVITAPLWNDLERGIIEREKSKGGISADEEHTQILDVLSNSPAHSISFTFITFALSRLASEIMPLRVTTPASPSQAFQEAFHNQLRDHDEVGRRRQQIEGAYANIFADAMIRTPNSSTVGSSKARKALEARKRKVIEVFLSSYS